jgi:hypothetical protein
MSRKYLVGIVGALLCLLPEQSRADFFSDVGRTLGSAAQIIIDTSTAPIRIPEQILRGDNPASVLTGQFRSAGETIERASDVFQQAQSTFSNIPRDTISRSLGPEWRDAFDILTASQRVQFELATTSGRFFGRCLQGQQCDVATLAAAPLAAAMRDAYKVYIGHSAPLGPELIDALSSVMPRNILINARFVIGIVPNFTIPGFLNAAHQATGSGHAVTLANLMVFSEMPNPNAQEGLTWLLHELRHIEQYARYSSDYLEAIDGFAIDYLQRYRSLEDDAESNASRRFDLLIQNINNRRVQQSNSPMGNICRVGFAPQEFCFLPGYGPLGAPCFCNPGFQGQVSLQ